MKRPERKKRLDIPSDRRAWLSMKKISVDVAERLHVLAARKNWTVELCVNNLLLVGLDAYESEAEEGGA